MQRTYLFILLILALALGAKADPSANIQRDSIEALSISIFGPTEVSVDKMYKFVNSRNSKFPREVAQAFYDVAGRYGIRGDIALCQAILETGWFRHVNLTDSAERRYNFGGIGCTGPGVPGNSFASLEEGVTASIQHLYAYACTDPLPIGEVIVDPRFKLVTRGVAPTWGDLSNRWAMNPYYGQRIISLYNMMKHYKPAKAKK